MWGWLRRYGGRVRTVVSRGSVADGHIRGSVVGLVSQETISVDRVRGFVTATAFWVAIPLPFLYVPVLLSGLQTRAEALALAALIAVHVIALRIGYPYAADKRDDQ